MELTASRLFIGPLLGGAFTENVAVDTETAVKAAGGRLNHSTSTVSTLDPENENEQYMHSINRKGWVKRYCKKRDGDRCVISKDYTYTIALFEECQKKNVPLPTEGHVVRTLEVAHIIPYSVTQSSESTVTASVWPLFPRRATLRKLTME